MTGRTVCQDLRDLPDRILRIPEHVARRLHALIGDVAGDGGSDLPGEQFRQVCGVEVDVVREHRHRDALVQVVADIVHAFDDRGGMHLAALHVGHGPGEEGHHIGVQPAHLIRGSAAVDVLDVEVGSVVSVLLVHAALDGEPRGQRDRGDEQVFRVAQRVVADMAVQAGCPQPRALADGGEVAVLHQLVLLHLLHIPVVPHAVLPAQEVEIAQFGLADHGFRHRSSFHSSLFLYLYFKNTRYF